MSPDLVADVGNTRIKLMACGFATRLFAAVADDLSVELDQFSRTFEAANRPPPYSWAIAGSNPDRVSELAAWVLARGDRVRVVDSYRELPIDVRVPAPERVGLDRLFDSVAVNARRRTNKPAVVIDAGTAITVNAIAADGAFLGGAIVPGLRTMRRALHDYTAKLPFVENTPVDASLPATSTAAAIYWGTHWAVVGGVERIVAELGLGTDFDLFVTGGDGEVIANGFRGRTVEFDPMLTCEGIRLTAEALP